MLLHRGLSAAAGDSVAINGVCLTVVRIDSAEVEFDVVAESLARSTLGELQAGDAVNVDPSLRAGDPLGGHFVYGHVDATSEILSKEVEGPSFRLSCATPPLLAPMIVEKGFIAADGVSLTVAEVRAGAFGVVLVPETLKRTTLGRKGVGAKLNIEVDPLARYVAAQLAAQLGTKQQPTIIT